MKIRSLIWAGTFLLCFFLWENATAQLVINSQELKVSELRQTLTAVEENGEVIISLPNHEGVWRKYRAVESNFLSEELKQRRSDYRSFIIEDVKNSQSRGRLAISQFGIQALVRTSFGTIYYENKGLLNSGEYYVYLNHNPLEKQEQKETTPWCVGSEKAPDYKEPVQRINHRSNGILEHGDVINTYDLAIVASGSFYENNGSSIPMAETVIMNSVNSIQAIYEVDVAVKFNLLDPFIYTDSSTDPFNAPPPNLTKQAADAVNDNFSVGDYDIGHVFHNSGGSSIGGGGVAGLGVVCSNSLWMGGPGRAKAAGWSGSFSNTSNGWIQLAAHEFGHMFDATHTFNGSGGSCSGGNFSPTTNYEIGSGSTIMSYQGSCGSGQNIPSLGVADNYFHANSLDRMVSYINSSATCGVDSVAANTPPTADADPCELTHQIPKNTPFEIIGEATDPDGDVLSYSWEQYDNDGPSGPTQGKVGADAAADPLAPLFRSFPPSSSPNRIFPSVPLLINGEYASTFEPLPTVDRTLTFRLSVRDNTGGLGMDEMEISVEDHGPFEVTSPNGGEIFDAGDNIDVEWDVNGTDAFCDDVNIYLSIDGGNTFPIILAEMVPNNGLNNLEIPEGTPNTEMARIKVACADNPCVVFFDISDDDFEVESGCLVINSSICPLDPVTETEGSPNLNLDLEFFPGNSVFSHTFSTGGGSPSFNLVTEAFGGGCKEWGFSTLYDIIEIVVTESGTYNFTIEDWSGSNFLICNVFEDPLDQNDPCDTWLACNVSETSGGAFSGTSTVSLDLEVCESYIVTLSRISGTTPLTNDVQFSGPGEVIIVEDLPTDYAYTYLAVNQSTEVVDAVSTSADFSGLGNGNFCVWGAMYKDGGPTPPPNVDPNDFIGQSIDDINASGDCVLLSLDCKPVEVESAGGCNASFSLAGANSVENPPFNSVAFCPEESNPIPVISGNSGGVFSANSVNLVINSSTGEINLSASSSGTYIVSYEDSTGDGCEESVEVVIHSSPSPNAFNTGPYCVGETIVLNASGGSTYSWEGPNGFNSTAQNPEINNAGLPNSGNYTVTVTDGNGCTGTASTNVTVNPLPTASANNSGPYCEGETIVLSASGGGTYNWEGPDGFSSTAQNPEISNAGLANSGNYTVTVTDGNGCTNTATTNVTVNSLPTASANNTGPYCEGETIVLSASGGGTYNWEGPDGFSSTAQNPEISNAGLANSGNYTVTVTDGNVCTNTATTSVTVNSLPTATANNTGPYCVGETIVLSANGGSSYNWEGPDGFSSTTQNPEINNAGLANSGIYTVTVTDGNGCTNTATTNVTVNPLPTASANNTGPYCEGETIVLSASGGGTYNWEGPDGFNSTAQNPEINNAGLANSGNYTVTVTDGNGCTNTATTDVTVNPLPTASANNTGPYCEGETIVLSASGGSSYNWEGPDGFSSTTQNPEINNAGLANSGNYTVTVTDGNGCTNTATTDVTVNPLPTASADNTGPYCEEETIVLSASGGSSYNWEGPDGFSSTAQNPEISNAGLANSGNYTVTVTDGNGCTNTATTNVAVNALPTASANNSGDYCPGDEIELSSAGGISYQWSGPAGFSSSEQNPTIPNSNEDNSGTYVVTVTDSNDCSDVDSTVVNVEDVIPPDLTCPNDLLVNTDFGECGNDLVIAPAIASDNCSLEEVFNDYNMEEDASDFYPEGVTEITFTALDETGNSATCVFAVEVVDNEGPAVNCPMDTTIILGSGESETFVQLEEASATDNCEVGTIVNSINDNGENASDTFGIGTTLITFTASDVSSNTTECFTAVTLIEGASVFEISGTVRRANDESLAGVVVNFTGDEEGAQSTDSDGEYSFEIEGGSSIEVIPERNTSWSEFVTTLDLILTQQHILGIATLDSPYKIIGADANNDGVLSTFDLVLVQSVIIGILDSIPGNTSWRFVPADYVFDDPENPLAEDFPESREYNNLSEDKMEEDWVAIKTGDVTWPPSGTRLAAGTPFNFILKQSQEAGNSTQLLEVRMPMVKFVVSGYQFEWNYDPNRVEIFKVVSTASDLPNLNEEQFLVNNENGVLRGLWYHGAGLEIYGGEVVFALEIAVDGELGSLKDLFSVAPRETSFLESVLFYGDKKAVPLGVSTDSPELIDNRLTDHGVRPNPWSSHAQLVFELDRPATVEIEWSTVDGKLLHREMINAEGGINKFDLGDQFPQGVILYTIRTDFDEVSGKMIKK